MITNETILKAANAAGLEIQAVVDSFGTTVLLNMEAPCVTAIDADQFNPLYNDADNAMIMDGAEANLFYAFGASKAWVSAGIVCSSFTNVDIVNDNKAQARREAVILCAAAKWDAMQGEGK